jgi:outer membrane protein TolC
MQQDAERWRRSVHQQHASTPPLRAKPRREAYRLARIGYDQGKTSLLELLTLRRALLDAKALTIDARLTRISALATLARLDGRIAFGDL